MAAGRSEIRQISLKVISKALEHYTSISAQDFAKLLHLAGDYQANELQVRRHDWLSVKTIAELGLRQEGIIVLGITRNDGNYLGAPDGDTAIQKGDVLIFYGRVTLMQDLDRRKAGYAGDRDHRKQIAHQKKTKKKEK